MSGAARPEEVVRSAVPIPDLSSVDTALQLGGDALREALKRIRPADLGRDLSRRPIAEGRRLLETLDERRGAAMLRAAHPSVAGRLLASCDPAHSVRVLEFIPTDHQVAILAETAPDDRRRIEQAMTPDDKSAPLITTLVDASGLFIYFSVAHLMIAQLH